MRTYALLHLSLSTKKRGCRDVSLNVLHHLREIDRRRLYIESGEISLTHIGLAQSLFKQEMKVQNKEMSRDQKLAVFEQIANKSVREAERLTLSMSTSPVTAKPDRINSISESHIELKFTASNSLQKKV